MLIVGNRTQFVALLCLASPRLSAFSASSDEVVAWERDMSYFCTMDNDSPSWPRSLVAAPCSAFSTSSFRLCLNLLASERIAGSSIDSFQSDDILPPDAVNAAIQHGLDAVALRDFAADFAGDAVRGAAAHELQCLADLLVGKDVQIRGLPEIDGQRFLESAIEDGIGGGVYEIGNQDRIFLGEGVSAPEKHDANAGGDQRDDQSRDQPRGQLAASTPRRTAGGMEELEEVAARIVPDSESRLRRFKSERTSAALW